MATTEKPNQGATNPTPSTADASARVARVVATDAAKKEGALDVAALVLVAVLLAAGAILKLTVASFFSFAGMKPNFIIAMYCLAILLVRPNIAQSVVIGFLAGAICQLPMLNATPLVNLASETLGGLAMGLLVLVPMTIGKLDLHPTVATFLSTVVSGYTFALIVGCAINGNPVLATIGTYAVMVLGTAVFNAILVQVLYLPLKSVLRK